MDILVLIVLGLLATLIGVESNSDMVAMIAWLVAFLLLHAYMVWSERKIKRG